MITFNKPNGLQIEPLPAFSDNYLWLIHNGIDAAVVDGQNLEATITSLFDNDASQRIYVHSAVRGCWAVTVERAAG